MKYNQVKLLYERLIETLRSSSDGREKFMVVMFSAVLGYAKLCLVLVDTTDERIESSSKSLTCSH
jgi:hypothetical protein